MLSVFDMDWLGSSTKGTGDEEKSVTVFIRYYGARIHSEIEIRPMAGQPETKYAFDGRLMSRT